MAQGGGFLRALDVDASIIPVANGYLDALSWGGTRNVPGFPAAVFQ